MNSSNRKRHCIAALISSTVFSTLASAAQPSQVQPIDQLASSSPTLVVSLSGGPAWQNTLSSQTFYLTPTIEKTFTARHQKDPLPVGELFIGMQSNIPKLPAEVLGQLGLNFSTGDTSLNGNIWDDADPTFNNYTYSYKVQHWQLALAGKLLLADPCYYGIIPWFGASAGVGINNAHSYHNTPLLFEAVTMPNFRSHTETSFTYSVSLGVQKALAPHWQVGLNYEFADWGKSQLSRAAGQSLNTGLSFNHLYTNGVLFNLTYLA